MAKDKTINDVVAALDKLNDSLMRGAPASAGGTANRQWSRAFGTRDDPAAVADKLMADKTKNGVLGNLMALYSMQNRTSGYMQQLLKNSSSQLEYAIADSSSVRKLASIPSVMKTIFESVDFADPKMVNTILGDINELKDVIAAKDRFQAMGDLADLAKHTGSVLQEIMDGIDPRSVEEATSEFKRHAKELGYSAEMLNEIFGPHVLSGSAEHAAQSIENLGKVAHNLEFTQAEVASANNKLTKRLEANEKAFGLLGAGVMLLGGAINDIAKESARYGSTIQWTNDAFLQTGMGQRELIQLQGEYRQSLMALGEGFEGHTAMLIKNQEELFKDIGTVDGVTRANAAFLDLAQTVGGTKDKNKLNGMISQQVEQFHALHNITGMTIEQFNDFNKEMLENSTAYSIMFRMEQDSRRDFIQSFGDQLKFLTTRIGMTSESAKGVIRQFQDIGGMKAKDRIEKSWKVAAIAGAFGLGEQGAVLQRGIQRGQIQTPEFISAMKDLSDKMSATGQTTQGELIMDEFSDVMGDFVGKNSPMAAATIESGKAIDTTIRQNDEIIKGLPRTGSAALEEIWLKASPFLDKATSALGNINLTLTAGFASTIGAISMLSKSSMIGGIFDKMGTGKAVSKGFGKILMSETVGSLSMMIGPALKATGFGLVAGSLVEGIIGGIGEYQKSGEFKDVAKEFANGFIPFFDPFSTESGMLADPDKHIAEIGDRLTDHLTEIKVPIDHFVARTDEAIKRLTEEDIRKEDAKLEMLKKEVEGKNASEKETTRILQEIKVIQEHMHKVSTKQLEEQKNTNDAVTKQTDAMKDAYASGKTSYDRRALLMDQANSNSTRINP